MNGSFVGLLGFALMATVGAQWLRLMQQVRIPKDTTAFVLANAAAALLGATALALGAGPLGTIAAVLALAGGLMFVALRAASGQAKVVPAVAVGRPVVDFAATDDEGRPFTLSSLRGRPVLLKFFRGHWCPYCTAELRRWNELAPELGARGIAIVTVCADTAEQIRAGRHKHGLPAVMVPDPDLALTDRYHLRNPRGLALKSGVIVPLPIPTTILVDAGGVVRWIDQSEDYMHRSDPERVLGAIRSALDRPESGRARAS